MKKTNALWIILDLIFLIIFNLLFFILDGPYQGTAAWISYGFIHFAYFMLLVTPALTTKGRSSADTSPAIYSISAAYFIIELITGVIFILAAPDSTTAALIVQICIAGLYALILLPNMIANEHTAAAVEKRQQEIAYVKDAGAKLKGILERVSDMDTKRKIERLYDTVNSSPVKSHPNLAELENRIIMSIYELEDQITAGNLQQTASVINSLQAAVSERNIRLKNFN